ncbi:MAG: hypothetical protein SNJ53_00625 [Thermodesulfovibrionales bacterium]
MAVEGVKNSTAQMAQEMLAKNLKEQNVNQTNQTQVNNQQQDDRVTLNSRQNENLNTNQRTSQTEQRNPAMTVPGQSQRPTALRVEPGNQENNNNVAAQMIKEAANKTSATQQANNPYNPNKPNQTQNQINYTV